MNSQYESYQRISWAGSLNVSAVVFFFFNWIVDHMKYHCKMLQQPGYIKTIPNISPPTSDYIHISGIQEVPLVWRPLLQGRPGQEDNSIKNNNHSHSIVMYIHSIADSLSPSLPFSPLLSWPVCKRVTVALWEPACLLQSPEEPRISTVIYSWWGRLPDLQDWTMKYLKLTGLKEDGSAVKTQRETRRATRISRRMNGRGAKK